MRLVAIAPNPSIDRFFVVDRLRRGAINRPILEVQVAGGKGLNVARAATALGANVSVLTFLAGHAGRWIADELAREGVPSTYVRTDGETRTCVTIHDAADGRLTELYEAGPTVGADDWNRFETALRAQVNDGKVGLVAVSGSLPPGAPPDGVARIVSIAHAASVPSIVDAGGEPLALALRARPWMVKVNILEAITAAQLAGIGGPTDQRMPADDEGVATALARALSTRICGPAIITRGSAGAVAAYPDGPTLHIAPGAIRGRYPVGSGDAFLAGLAAATLAGEPLDLALKLAAGAAAANALLPGAGRLNRLEAVSLAESVEISRVSDEVCSHRGK
jgi:1-phosphofructokinase family hexose kinase